jgi:hypothetical protein
VSIAPTFEARPLTLDYQRLVNAVFALFTFSGIISVIEPSPYDFMSLIPIPLWFIGGFRVHAALVPILFIKPLRACRIFLPHSVLERARSRALSVSVALSLCDGRLLLDLLFGAHA